MQDKNWKLPLNVAIVIHLLVFLGAVYLPEIFKTKPRFADVYTVSIVNVAEPANGPQAPAKAPKAASRPPAKVVKSEPPRPVKTEEALPPPVVTPPVKSRTVAPIAETPKPVEPAPPKAISLKPIKKKIIQEDPKLEELARKEAVERKQELEKKEELEKKQEIDKKEEIARKQELDRKQRQQRQKLAQALREEELLAEKARLAQEAVNTERELLESSQDFDSIPSTTARATESSGSGTQSTNASAAGGSSSLLESQYLAAVANRLHQFWTPPEYLQQDPNLTAVVVITVTVDGTVADVLFEGKSGNRIFDQFVSKTIETAAPLPPIPPALKKQRLEIGLRFKPGSIQ